MDNRLEEYKVWPALGSGAGIGIGFSFAGTVDLYHLLLMNMSELWYFAGYIFPIILGASFAFRLAGKYWLGFAWVALIVYYLALVARLISTDGVIAEFFLIGTCLAILFGSQAAVLFLKRRLQLGHSPSE